MHSRAPSPEPPHAPPGPLPLEKALAFFREFYRGEHHIPNGNRCGSDGVKRHGLGWCVVDYIDLSSFDFDDLTRLLFLAHDMCVRVSVQPMRGCKVKIAIWNRHREGSMSTRHPTLEQAVEAWRARHPLDSEASS